MEKRLGHISSVRVGFGGHQDTKFGVTFDLCGDVWAECDFWDFMFSDVPSNKSLCQTEGIDKLKALMKAANATDIEELQWKPIELFFEDGLLKTWRLPERQAQDHGEKP